MTEIIKSLDPDHPYSPILKSVRDQCDSHKFMSGEIIVEVAQIVYEYSDVAQIFQEFCKVSGLGFHDITYHKDEGERWIASNNLDTTPIEIDREQAYAELNNTFGVKVNFTALGTVFSLEDIKQIRQEFFGIFTYKPRFYIVRHAEIYKAKLPQGDFWQSYGVFVVDEKYAGLIWVNDLYDYEKPETELK